MVCFDLETTGLDKQKDQIIQFAGIKFDPQTFKIIDSLNLIIQPVVPYQISLQAWAKHGVTPDKLRDKPHLKDVAQQIIDFIGDDDILTYNGNSFDIDLLERELNKYGFSIDWMSRKMYDSCLEERRRNSNTLGDTYKRYKGKSMEDAGLTAHDAFSDVKATITIFAGQNKVAHVEPEKVYGLDNAIKDMDFVNLTNVPCFAFGKYKGVPLEWIKKNDPGYLTWAVSDAAHFDKYTKAFIKKFI